MVQSIGLLEEDRLVLIPSNYWGKHEFCFYLHDQIVHMLTQYETKGIHNVVSQAFSEAIRGREQEFDSVDILQWMKEQNLVDSYRHHILGNVTLALTADMLDFLYQALRAFEKRKFSVGFSLLRKPLKEHMLYLAWILADDADFISRFESKNYETLSGVTKERRIELMSRAISQLPSSEMFDPEVIWAMIYSKKHPNGFEPTWQRATHLVTSMGDLLKTGDYSLNFVFEDRNDNGYYDFLYSKLPYLLIYVMQLSTEAFNKIQAVNETTYGHLVLTTLGCYESLFLDGRSQSVARMLNSQMGELLKCIHCDARLKITKKTAPVLYLTERIPCKNCGLMSEIPLYWLFSRAKIKILRDGKGQAYLRNLEQDSSQGS